MSGFEGKYSDGKIVTHHLKNLRPALRVFTASAGANNMCSAWLTGI